ncbi:hypothetical protein BRADI_3g36484v3 [Brachypodium distachyon]|uniref:Uncharacterized protein n=1 Tax=Brachypodium distachyon TaxID=15368 RepID=A0A0Q3FJM6_BRADI|nr:hypothetical protein BRADI_3g36484v3 [Brachypodium distachyon]
MSGWWPPVSLVRRSVALLRFPMLPDAARLPRPLRRPPLAAKVQAVHDRSALGIWEKWCTSYLPGSP